MEVGQDRDYMRPMTDAERTLAVHAMRYTSKAIAGLARGYPGIRHQIAKIDAEAVAYLAVCRAAQTYDSAKSQPTTYFSTAIRNAIIKEIARSKRAIVDGPDRVPMSIAEETVHRMPDHDVVLAVSALPESAVSLIRRRFYDGHTLSDIAAEEGCARSTVRRRLSRALRLLKSALEILPRTQR